MTRIAGRIRQTVIVSALIVASFLPMVVALGQDQAFDPYPLRTADTSSPRDTLRSFLRYANEMIQDWRGQSLGASTSQALRRAVETLDLSTTAYSDAWGEQVLNVLRLKEILDRVELPPTDEIPGDDEVANGTVAQWTIPNTRISIARVEVGPRTGEYLFAADSVQRLGRLYREAKHLPYKPGASVGAYDDYLRADNTLYARAAELRIRLKTIDTSTPRSTLEGFMESINRAYALVMETDAALKADPPKMTLEEARENEAAADNLFRRAAGTFDLSQVPRALRADVGLETALRVKEILDRAPLPPLDAVPDAQIVSAARQGKGSSFLQSTGALRWEIPNTGLVIAEITEGEREGQFLFSARTVRLVPDLYLKVRDLPYRDDKYDQASEFRSPGTSEGLYDYYVSTPGYLIPGTNFLGRFVDRLPASLKALHGGQTLWQWIGLALAVLLVVVTVYVVFRVVRSLARRLEAPLDTWVMILVPIIVAVVLLVVSDFVDRDLGITGDLLDAVTAGDQAIVFLMGAWAVFIFFKALAETVIASPKIQPEGVDASLLRIGARIVGFLLGAWILIDGIQDLGADLIPLLAGLGVGGLAVALAAQKTLANFIGSLILFANNPVRVGDFCRYGDQIGTVEEIGLHSTRIRSLERTVVTVPNAEFSEMKLDNFAARDRRLFKTVLQLRYETTPEQMRFFLARLRELLLGHPKVTPDPARARFVGYGPYSKDVEIFAYLACQDQDTFLAIREDLLLRIEDLVVEAGTGFAFPSQTAYLARDTGVDAERRGQAESAVQAWRATAKLPFPEFEEEERERLEDVLDYPPQGSPDHRPRGGESGPPILKDPSKSSWFKRS